MTFKEKTAIERTETSELRAKSTFCKKPRNTCITDRKQRVGKGHKDELAKQHGSEKEVYCPINVPSKQSTNNT